MILDELAAYSKLRVEQAKQQLSFEAIKEKATQLRNGALPSQRLISHPDVRFPPDA